MVVPDHRNEACAIKSATISSLLCDVVAIATYGPIFVRREKPLCVFSTSVTVVVVDSLLGSPRRSVRNEADLKARLFAQWPNWFVRRDRRRYRYQIVTGMRVKNAEVEMRGGSFKVAPVLNAILRVLKIIEIQESGSHLKWFIDQRYDLTPVVQVGSV